MTRLRTQEIALLLFLVGVPLVSIGSTRDAGLLWWAGLLMFLAAGLLPPLTRYVFTTPDPREEADMKDEP